MVPLKIEHCHLCIESHLKKAYSPFRTENTYIFIFSIPGKYTLHFHTEADRRRRLVRRFSDWAEHDGALQSENNLDRFVSFHFSGWAEHDGALQIENNLDRFVSFQFSDWAEHDGALQSEII